MVLSGLSGKLAVYLLIASLVVGHSLMWRWFLWNSNREKQMAAKRLRYLKKEYPRMKTEEQRTQAIALMYRKYPTHKLRRFAQACLTVLFDVLCAWLVFHPAVIEGICRTAAVLDRQTFFAGPALMALAGSLMLVRFWRGHQSAVSGTTIGVLVSGIVLECALFLLLPESCFWLTAGILFSDCGIPCIKKGMALQNKKRQLEKLDRLRRQRQTRMMEEACAQEADCQ